MKLISFFMSQFQNVSVQSSSRRIENFNPPDFIGNCVTHTKRIPRIEIFDQRGNRPKWGVLKLALMSMLLITGFLAGCAMIPVIEEQENALPPMPFPELIKKANQYKGKGVILGGYVLEVENHKDYTRISAVQAPLGLGQRLESKDLSKGRLILIYDEFIDPEVYTKDRQIAVGGTILDGAAYDPELSFPYLKIHVESIYLWPKERPRQRDCLCDDVWLDYHPWFWGFF